MCITLCAVHMLRDIINLAAEDPEQRVRDLLSFRSSLISSWGVDLVTSFQLWFRQCQHRTVWVYVVYVHGYE